MFPADSSKGQASTVGSTVRFSVQHFAQAVASVRAGSRTLQWSHTLLNRNLIVHV